VNAMRVNNARQNRVLIAASLPQPVSPVLPGQTPSNNKGCLATWHRKFPWVVLESRRRLAGQLFFLPPRTARSSQASSCLLMVKSPKFDLAMPRHN
jgi:hypothetical protein